MNDQPCISVVVPFYNCEGTLAACIESLLSQKNVDGRYEILMIDNRSTDASASVVKRYGGLIVLDEQTPGAYAARNTGIRRASSPLIAFTDADCAVDSDWLRSILDGMQDAATGVLVGHCRYPDEASMACRLLAAYENAKTEYVIGRCNSAFHFAYCNNMAVRASVFEEIGHFKPWQRAADSELVHRLASRLPNLKLGYRHSMRITHLEFSRARDRARRLKLYTSTNSKIETFRELNAARRVGVLLHLLRSYRASE